MCSCETVRASSFERDEIKSRARLGASHPGIAARFHLERESRLHSLFSPVGVLDHHGTRKCAPAWVLRRLPSLGPRWWRPPPSGLIDAQTDCHGPQEGMASRAAVEKHST